MLRRLICMAVLAASAVGGDAPLWAQRPPQDDHERADLSGSADSAEGEFASDPVARLDRAEEAFQDADYEMLRPLLEPTLQPNSRFMNPQQERQARTLLGVGLYFEAQQVTDAEHRRRLLDQAQSQFLEILRVHPDHSLNALIYPASVVELFEAVKEEHADELEQIRAERDESNGAGDEAGLRSVYIERQLSHRPYAGNFIPFGVGQFQNGETAQAALFGGAQAAALGLNVASYLMIESLRDSTGRFAQGPGNAAEQAHQWRVAQYVGLGLFVGFYAWSVFDALGDYQPYEVRIRTLDEPPPELSSPGPSGRDTGGFESAVPRADDKQAAFQIGLGGLGWSW